MTRGEASKLLNSLMESVARLREECSSPTTPKVAHRLDAIQDNVLLIALDLGLPLRPVTQEK